MKNLNNQDFRKEVISEKLEYVAPEFQCIDIEMESPILNASNTYGTGASSFGDGGRYGRSSSDRFDYEW